MALLNPSRTGSLFTTPIAGAIDPKFTFTAKDGEVTIAKGDFREFDASAIFGYSQDDAKQAQYKLGFIRDDLQEQIRNEALTNYNDYLIHKKERLQGIRAEAINAYGQQVVRLRALGYDNQKAEEKATEFGKMIYNSLMEQFRILYPADGKKEEVVKNY